MATSLKKLEKKMESNQKAAWYENSLIMLKIRNEGLHKKKYGTFENYLEDRWNFNPRRGRQLIKAAEFMQIVDKNMAENRHKNDKFVPVSKPILPSNEAQCRPLLEKLSHHGERIKVWAEVVATGEKINAELVQTKVDEFLESGEDVPDIEYVETKIINISPSGTRHNSSKENDWYTPEKYIDSVKLILGSINLDPATSDLAQSIVQADKYYTEQDDGLSKDWEAETVFLNPPYSMPEIKKFIDKLIDEKIPEWIVLTNNSSDTKWFHKLAVECDLMCFTIGRVGFENAAKEVMATRQGQTFFYKGNNREVFKREFSKYGIIVEVK